MTTVAHELPIPLLDKEQLIQFLKKGEKTESEWLIGSEHEKFIVDQKTLMPLPYEGERSILAIFKELLYLGWEPIFDEVNIIALQRGRTIISLEPGGQLELSGAPQRNLRAVEKELYIHLNELAPILEKLNAKILWKGFHPLARREEMASVPKSRYKLMNKYIPTVGTRGLDMMYRTASIQVNLDYDSERDMAQKIRIGLSLTPLTIALFANSDEVEGQKLPFKSYRAFIWHDTDKVRSGIPPSFLDETMSYERYVDYALNIPMFFIIRDGHYVDALGVPFKDFFAKKSLKLKNYEPLLGDWENHLTTIFPEVRVKNYLEFRAMDTGSPKKIIAAAGFWVGLLYDRETLLEIYEIVKKWPKEDIIEAYYKAPIEGLDTELLGRKLSYWAEDIISLATKGLEKRETIDFDLEKNLLVF